MEKIFIKEKNKQGNGYVGYINRKVTFINFKFPKPFTGIGYFTIDKNLLIDKGNYNILNKIILPNPLIIEGGIKVYDNICTCGFCHGYEVEGYKYKTGGRNPSAIFYNNENYKILKLSYKEFANEYIDEYTQKPYIEISNSNGHIHPKIFGTIVYRFKESRCSCAENQMLQETIIYRRIN